MKMYRLFPFFFFFLFIFPVIVNSQAFDNLNTLVKEREILQAGYDKINAQVKAAKNKKPTPEWQTALEKLIAKDAEIVNEINIVQAEVTRQQKELLVKKDKEREKEKTRPIGKKDRNNLLLIDSLYDAIAQVRAQNDSLLAGTISNNSLQESLQNELKSTTEEKYVIQKELDGVKTDKFILARRNMILLYFNVGVAILLFSSLVFVLLSFRRKKKVPGIVSVQDLTPSKPRPITGFNQAVPKIAFEAFDTRLDKIEKLGKLREKGLLSDEEFNMQKQQILNSKNDR